MRKDLIEWIKDDGYHDGRHDCITLDHWSQLKERLIKNNCLTEDEAVNIPESTWEYYFRVWKEAEDDGIWAAEDEFL